MNPDNLILGIIYIAVFFLLFFAGKIIYNLLHREFDLNKELVENDNPAVCLGITGYYAGLVMCLGGAVAGPSNGLASDIMDLFVYGALGIILLNISIYLCDFVILYKFKIKDELLRDRNQGTGAVIFGVALASGFVIYGSVSGEGGNIWTASVFWLMGQILLFAAAWFYNLITPYDIQKEIENDNVAAGISFAGALIAVGIVVGLSAEGEFVSWQENIFEFLSYAAVGLVSLPVVRFLTDKLLLPGVKLSDEITGLHPDKSIEKRGPNIGAAYIEAFAYIAGAFVIYWCI